MSVRDVELVRSKQLTNILKVLGEGGPGECLWLKDQIMGPVVTPVKAGVQERCEKTGFRLSRE